MPILQIIIWRKKKMKIYVARHGETFWNSQGKVQTYSNGPETYLTKKGKEDTKKRGTILSKEPIEVTYHSTLHRAKQTAQIISQSLDCKKIIEDARINDGCLSFLDGLTMDEIKEKFPEIWKAREKEKFHYRIPNLFPEKNYPIAESMEDVLHRVSPLLEEVVNDKKNTLIIGHKGVNRVILYYLLKNSDYSITNKDLSRIKIPNEAIYKITIELNSKKIKHNLGEGWFEGILIE